MRCMDWLCGVETTTWCSVAWAALVKKAQQRIYFLRTPSKAHLSARLIFLPLQSGKHIDVLHHSFVWKTLGRWQLAVLQRIIKTSQKIIGLHCPLLSMFTGLTTTAEPATYSGTVCTPSRSRNSFYPSAIYELNFYPLPPNPPQPLHQWYCCKSKH